MNAFPVFLSLIFMTTSGSVFEKSSVYQAVELQLLKYPESSLKDIYKSFFQDEYGPGHLLEDTVSARKYFDYELSVMKSKAYYEDEPCGLGNNFYRASMDCIVDGLVDADDYFTAFIKSSKDFSLPDIEGWKEKWEAILKEIFPLRGSIHHFEKDMTEISDLLNRGEYVVHHSERYTKAYDPHYRIMRKIPKR